MLLNLQVQPGPRWPAWVVRWLINVVLYLTTTLTGALIVLVFYDFYRRQGLDLDFVFYAWTLGTLLLAPGALAYLALLELIPSAWPGHVRRALAVFLTPLLFLGMILYRGGFPRGADPWMYALLAALGLLVRLRHPKDASTLGAELGS
jgi:hypothetical protein